MTTIVATRKSMASDSRITGCAVCYCDKVFRIRDSLVGVCGDNAFTTKWLEWFRRDCPPVDELMDIDEEKDFLALEVNAKGIWMYTNTCEPDKLQDKFYSIGSGSDAAMGALHAGKGPVEAIRIAALVDEKTGGKIREMFLLPPRKEKKPAKPKLKPVTEPQPKAKHVEASQS